jgi:hypothetical protein
MRFVRMRIIAATLGATLPFVAPHPSQAQSVDPKAAEHRQQPGDAKDGQKKPDEFAEAAKLLGGPAAFPECVWLGRRVVSLLWRDDLDTAFRHLDLYERFGCPAGHVQATFRCLTKFADQIDDKVQKSLDDRVHACWINPRAQPQTAAAAAPAPPPSTAGAAPATPSPSPSPPAAK